MRSRTKTPLVAVIAVALFCYSAQSLDAQETDTCSEFNDQRAAIENRVALLMVDLTVVDSKIDAVDARIKACIPPLDIPVAHNDMKLGLTWALEICDREEFNGFVDTMMDHVRDWSTTLNQIKLAMSGHALVSQALESFCPEEDAGNQSSSASTSGGMSQPPCTATSERCTVWYTFKGLCGWASQSVKTPEEEEQVQAGLRKKLADGCVLDGEGSQYCKQKNSLKFDVKKYGEPGPECPGGCGGC